MTEHKRLKFDGQAMRLLRWLRDNPNSSSIDMTRALWIANTTGRISDLRAAGYVVECHKDGDGVARYRVVEPKAVTSGEQTSLAL